MQDRPLNNLAVFFEPIKEIKLQVESCLLLSWNPKTANEDQFWFVPLHNTKQKTCNNFCDLFNSAICHFSLAWCLIAYANRRCSCDECLSCIKCASLVQQWYKLPPGEKIVLSIFGTIWLSLLNASYTPSRL